MTEPRDRAARILDAWWPPAAPRLIYGYAVVKFTLEREALHAMIEREIREAVEVRCRGGGIMLPCQARVFVEHRIDVTDVPDPPEDPDCICAKRTDHLLSCWMQGWRDGYKAAKMAAPKQHRSPIRPTWESLLSSVGGPGYIACPCGQTLQSQEATREHWQRGHFDHEA